MYLFGGHQRKTFVQIKAHLVAKDTLGTRACAVGFGNAMASHMLHEVFVLAAYGAHKGNWVKIHMILSGAPPMLVNYKVLYANWRIDGYGS